MTEEKKITFRELLNGDVLLKDFVKRQYKLLLFIGALIFLYIFIGFQAQQQQHRLTELQKEQQNKHFEQLTIESELTKRTRQSTVSGELRNRGSELKENKQPVVHIP